MSEEKEVGDRKPKEPEEFDDPGTPGKRVVVFFESYSEFENTEDTKKNGYTVTLTPEGKIFVNKDELKLKNFKDMSRDEKNIFLEFSNAPTENESDSDEESEEEEEEAREKSEKETSKGKSESEKKIQKERKRQIATLNVALSYFYNSVSHPDIYHDDVRTFLLNAFIRCLYFGETLADKYVADQTSIRIWKEKGEEKEEVPGAPQSGKVPREVSEALPMDTGTVFDFDFEKAIKTLNKKAGVLPHS